MARYVEQDIATAFDVAFPIFESLFTHMKELSKKKPDQTLNQKKVEILNKVLSDLLEILSGEAQSKYLELLDDETLPLNSDVVLMMSQFKTAANKFKWARSTHGVWDVEEDEYEDEQ